MIRKAIIAGLTSLALATLVVGWRSTSHPMFWIIRETQTSWVIIRAVHGKFVFIDQISFSDPQGMIRQELKVWLQVPPLPWVEYRSWHWSPGVASAGAPCWAVALLFATYPAIAFIRGPLRRYRRRKRGWCIHCGYDLTGNVTGVCSECGVQT